MGNFAPFLAIRVLRVIVKQWNGHAESPSNLFFETHIFVCSAEPVFIYSLFASKDQLKLLFVVHSEFD